MLRIWWDIKGILYYDLLQTGETVNADHYKHQLQRLNEEFDLKRFITEKGRRPLKLLLDNARPHIARSAKYHLVGKLWNIRRILPISLHRTIICFAQCIIL